VPLEIEIKLQVDSLDDIRARLAKAKAQRVGSTLETNIFFDRPDRSLLAANSGLRIRIEKHETGGSATALLTFKGPPQTSVLHPREAFDVAVDPPDQAISLVEALGFHRTLAFEKRRESWTLGRCKVELDELPFLGTFMEIEGPSEEAVLAVRTRLGLSAIPAVKPSYIQMVDAYMREHPVPNSTLTFPA